MKYCVENDLSSFDFHDSLFSYVNFDGRDLVVSASRVNIHKDTAHNPSKHDMEIACAQITFKNFRAVTYEPGITWKTGEDGKSYPVDPRAVFRGQDAIDRIIEALQGEIMVYHFEKEEGSGYSIGGAGTEPYFEVKFDFDSVVICWDEYKKKAWYELHRHYRYDAVLNTPNGDETVQLIVICHEEPVYYKGRLEQPPIVNVVCTYVGKGYRGHGSDYLWIDAFADLQKQLPEGVLLKCCLNCKHGNLCPTGNNVNEVFCTKDVLIRQKSDLFFYTEDNLQRAKRLKQYCDVCEDHRPQTDGFYTYNDYLHFLQKM